MKNIITVAAVNFKVDAANKESNLSKDLRILRSRSEARR